MVSREDIQPACLYRLSDGSISLCALCVSVAHSGPIQLRALKKLRVFRYNPPHDDPTEVYATNRGRVVLAKNLFFSGNTVINPGSLLTAAYMAWSLAVVRRTRSTRMGAIALFTCSMVGFAILTYVGTFLRGPNWDFYWSESQWPVH